MCLKELDCKATLELLIDGNYEELKNFERCFEYNQLSSISYFCPLLESSKPTRRPQQKGEKEAYFAKLKQICGMAGNLSKLFEKELFHSNIQTPSSGCSTMTEEEVANIETPLSEKKIGENHANFLSNTRVKNLYLVQEPKELTTMEKSLTRTSFGVPLKLTKMIKW